MLSVSSAAAGAIASRVRQYPINMALRIESAEGRRLVARWATPDATDHVIELPNRITLCVPVMLARQLDGTVLDWSAESGLVFRSVTDGA